MTTFQIMKSSDVLIEIGQSSMKAHYRDTGLELPLERTSHGQLTVACLESVASHLNSLLHKKSGLGRPRAICAIGARGVLLRRVTLPPSSKEQFLQALELLLERELPLPPDQLAWGYCRIGGEDASAAGQSAQELLVVAVKREVVEDYAGLLSSCGLNPLFTLGLLAAGSICSQWPGAYAVLDVGRNRSELMTLESGIPTAIRNIPWGGENITRALEESLGLNKEEAEALKVQWSEGVVSGPGTRLEGDRLRTAEAALGKAVDGLAACIPATWSGQKLYLTGKSVELPGFGERLAAGLGGTVDCERIEAPTGEGRSAVLLALRGFGERNGQGPPLVIRVKSASRPSRNLVGSTMWKWAALAAVLLLALLSLRYLEVWIKSPALIDRLAALETSKKNRPDIETELTFLQHLETNQPPYLDALSLVAGAAPRGVSIQSIVFTRRGELTLRSTMSNTKQATDFRSKLIESGWFTSVVLEEQTPVGNDKVTVRLSAHWKPGAPVPASATPPPAGQPASTATPPAEPPTSPDPASVVIRGQARIGKAN